ncbi:hypothetical protein ACFL0D_06205 [Thermoproteota archaeon]
MSSPQKRGNNKWGIVFSDSPNPELINQTLKVKRIWETVKYD